MIKVNSPTSHKNSKFVILPFFHVMDCTTYRNYLSLSCAYILRACLALAAREKLSISSSWHIRVNMFFGLVISAYMQVCDPIVVLGRLECH